MHKALVLSEEVKRELDWCAEMVNWPADVETRPRQQESGSSKIFFIHPALTNFFLIAICRLNNCRKYVAPGGCLATTRVG